MEDDRAQVDLGIAADIEEAQLAQAHEQPANTDTSQGTTKQPKKRFVGRRAAAEAAAKNTTNTDGESGPIQGSYTWKPYLSLAV